MDTYLKCLYDHIIEDLLTDADLDIMRYTRCAIAQDQAWDALKAALTSEQMDLVEDYQSARAGVCALEDELLFQEGIALGKWLAQI